MIASISGFLLLASDGIEGGFANGYMGTKGLLTAFLEPSLQLISIRSV